VSRSARRRGASFAASARRYVFFKYKDRLSVSSSRGALQPSISLRREIIDREIEAPREPGVNGHVPLGFAVLEVGQEILRDADLGGQLCLRPAALVAPEGEWRRRCDQRSRFLRAEQFLATGGETSSTLRAASASTRSS
jgi:hypothetical protein